MFQLRNASILLLRLVVITPFWLLMQICWVLHDVTNAVYCWLNFKLPDQWLTRTEKQHIEEARERLRLKQVKAMEDFDREYPPGEPITSNSWWSESATTEDQVFTIVNNSADGEVISASQIIKLLQKDYDKSVSETEVYKICAKLVRDGDIHKAKFGWSSAA